MKFGYQRAADGVFEGKGLRSFFEYRDLGIGAATGGKYHAQVIRATDVCRDGTGTAYPYASIFRWYMS